jgi:glycosyltransferase involved in cell wall biosynthesis
MAYVSSGLEYIMKNVVLMPVYNSAKHLRQLIDKIKPLGLDIVVVDDGSSDDSAQIAAQLDLTVLKHEINKGKGAALRTGIDYLKNKEYQLIIMMDSDGQHEPEDINKFIERYKTSQVAVIVGNRMADTKRMPLLRKATNKFMSVIISNICHQTIPDSQCGFRLVEKKAIDTIQLESSNYEIESEMLIKAARQGCKIDSIPISTVYREEKSYINPFVDTIRFVKLLFNVYFQK